MRTRQELFDLAWNGLKAQGFRQALDGGACSYRTPKGRKCAIGHCIPDERYSERFEGHALGYDDDELRKAAGVTSRSLQFAKDLQSAHDRNGEKPKRMEAALRKVAARYNLTVPS